MVASRSVARGGGPIDIKILDQNDQSSFFTHAHTFAKAKSHTLGLTPLLKQNHTHTHTHTRTHAHIC